MKLTHVRIELAILAATLTISPALAVPPIVGDPMKVDAGAKKANTNETSCASLDGAPGEIIATWNDLREGNWRCGVGLTTDGVNWTDFLLRPPAANRSSVEGDPMTCFDNRTGTLWSAGMTWTTNGGIFIAKKKPGQNEFEAPVMAQESGNIDKGWMCAGPDPDDSNKTMLYIAYNEGVISSADEGATWSTTPKNLGTGLGFLPRVASDGTLYVAYWDAGTQFKITRSTDRAKTFTSPHKKIAGRSGAWGIYDGPFPGTFRVAPLCSIAVDPNDPATVYCVYADNVKSGGGNTKVGIYFTKSTDKGDTWSAKQLISGVPDELKADAWFPWIETDRRARIHVFYYDTRNKLVNDSSGIAYIDTYYAYSDDGGATWGELRASKDYWNSETGRSGFIGDYTGAAIAGNKIHLCNTATEGDDPSTYVTTITDPRADMNCDGLANFDDIDPFVMAVIDQATYETNFPDCNYFNGDLDDNGVVNFDDIDPFVALLTIG